MLSQIEWPWKICLKRYIFRENLNEKKENSHLCEDLGQKEEHF